MRNNALKNAKTGFVTQIVILVIGFVVPRIMLVNYGSDTNGLITTITQIFSYMALLEAGIGTATRNMLYKPVAKNDRGEVSRIMSISRTYFWKITMYYAAGVILLSFLLPVVLKTDIDFWVIFWVVLFQGMSGVIKFLYVESWIQLLLAEGKQYVQSNINLLNMVLTYSIKIGFACLGINIAVMQFGFFCVSLVQLFVYKQYIKKNYSWVALKREEAKGEKLKDRNAFVLTEIAWTVFSSTDAIVIGITISTAMASVYGIYNMVYSNLSLVLNVVYTGLMYLLGQSFHKGIDDYKPVHDAFESLFMMAIGILMSCCSVLMLPFVQVYTSGVYDVNYLYAYFPLLFGLIQIFSWARYIVGNLSGLAGYANEVWKVSALEAAVNLILSIVLSLVIGIYGILIATVFALTIKLVYLTYLGNVKIMNRSLKKSTSKIIVNLLMYLGITFWFMFNPIVTGSLVSFFLIAVITFIATSFGYLLINLLVDRDSILNLITIIFKRRA